MMMVVFMGTTSSLLFSLFGQLQREDLTSPAEVNPDTLVCGATTVWVNPTALDDLLTNLVNAGQSHSQLHFRFITSQLFNQTGRKLRNWTDSIVT